jgi:hypothetical protein
VPSEVLADAINDIELRLLHDDPALVRRFRRLQRARVANTFTVVALLVVSAVLLPVGLATRSPHAWVAGVLAFLAAFAVDGRYQRRLGRPPPPPP